MIVRRGEKKKLGSYNEDGMTERAMVVAGLTKKRSKKKVTFLFVSLLSIHLKRHCEALSLNQNKLVFFFSYYCIVAHTLIRDLDIQPVSLHLD